MQNNKHRTLRTIQMNYPAPYSQSWADTEPVQMGIKKMKKCASHQANRNKLNNEACRCCWQHPKSLTHGSNPFAPHLKYGLFPRKNSLREQLNRSPIGKKSPVKNIHNINFDKFKDLSKTYKKDAPLFAIRPIDKQYTRRLSLSKVTHTDIEPQKSAPLPRVMSPLAERFRRRNWTNKRY